MPYSIGQIIAESSCGSDCSATAAAELVQPRWSVLSRHLGPIHDRYLGYLALGQLHAKNATLAPKSSTERAVVQVRIGRRA